MTPDKFSYPDTAPMGEPLPVEPTWVESYEVSLSPDIGKLVMALAKAQLAFKPVLKQTANEGFKRNGVASKYADLATYIDATQEALATNELVVMQWPDVSPGAKSMSLVSILAHSSGQWVRGKLTLPAMGRDGFTAQSCGSSITYARRYSYAAITGCASEDDDGNAASGRGTVEAAQAVGEQKIKDLQAKTRAQEQAKLSDLTGPLQDSIAAAQAHKPAGNGHGTPESVKASVEAAKDADLFDTLSGTIQTVRNMKTSPAKGSRGYRKIVLTTIQGAELIDVELSSFDNFKMSDTNCFEALDDSRTVGSTATLVVERNGKYLNLRDIKQIGDREWDARMGVIHRDTTQELPYR
jgi:hypothetical protein